jgi:hypothetical protein
VGEELAEDYTIQFFEMEENALRCNKLQLYPFFTLIHFVFIALRVPGRAGFALTVGSVLAASPADKEK